MSAWWGRELRASWRRHRRALGSTASTVALLATAISVSSAVFALVDGVILKPLPYAQPDRLVIVHGASQGAPRRALSGPAIDDLKSGSRALRFLEPYVSGGTAPLGTEGNVTIQATCSRAALFHALGARPMLGRLFSDGATDEVLVSHRLWHGRLGGDERILERRLAIAGRTRRVVGIMPPGFFFPDAATDVWWSITPDSDLTLRHAPTAWALGRLGDGLSIADARIRLEGGFRSLQAAYPGTDAGVTLVVAPIREALLGTSADLLWVVFVALLLLLGVAVANTSGVLIVRVRERQSEFGTRLAVGAMYRELQLLSMLDAVVLIAPSFLFSLVLTSALVAGLRGFLTSEFPGADRVAADGRVALFAGVAIIVSALVAGWSSSRYVARGTPASVIADARATARSIRAWRQEVLLAAQIALSVVLVHATVLVTNSFLSLGRIDWGFDPERLVVADVALPWLAVPDMTQHADVSDQIADRLRQLPGVKTVGVGDGVPGIYGAWATWHLADGRGTEVPGAPVGVWYVGGRYFAALGAHFVEGREFQDARSLASQRQVVIDTEVKRVACPLGCVGKTLSLLVARMDDARVVARIQRKDPTLWTDPAAFEEAGGGPWEIIGVVSPLRMFGAAAAMPPTVYIHHRMWHQSMMVTSRGWPKFVIRVDDTPGTLVGPVLAAIRSAAPNAEVLEASSMKELLARTIGGFLTQRLSLLVFGLLAGVALFVASMGVYAAVAYQIVTRRRDLAIRVAVGAAPGRLRVALATRYLAVGGFGVGAGALLAMLTVRALATSTTGWYRPLSGGFLTSATTGVVVLLSVAVAGVLALRRLSRVDPAALLRE